MSWIGRLFRRRPSGGDSPTALPSDVTEGEETDDVDDSWRELADALQKLTRLAGKQSLRIEELDSKVEGGFADLRERIEDCLPAATAQEIDWSPLLDAVDALDEAARMAGSSPAVATGLRGVISDIEAFLASVGLERRAAAGQAPDGHLFRVVGTEPSPALADGVVARVVRAAVLRSGEMLREGEVIVARRSA